MGVGACTLSNEAPEMKDALLQARIDGKSWKQIGEEFGFGSPGAARTAFKKITGIQDFKIKGKALKKLVDADLLDDLKKATPKKPPVSATGSSAPSASGAATGGTQGTFGSQASVYGDDVAKVWQNAFPGQPGKLTFEDTAEAAKWSKSYMNTKVHNQSVGLQTDLVGNHPISKINAALEDIKAGKYYSDITKKHGLTFAEVDAIFWSDAVLTNLSTYGDDVAKAVWNAYKKKPTSEYGFKAVQDMVWDLKKTGLNQKSITLITDVDKNVVDLILKNEWKLPAKGSKQYIGFSSPSPSYGGSTASQTASQLIGESNNFRNMTAGDADRWVQSYGQDLTQAQYQAVRSYTGSSYREYNGYLRGQGYVADGARAQKTIDDIRAAMRPAPDDVTVYRGVGREAFPQGIPSVGDAYMDRGFLSTSYGGKSAFGGDYRLIIDVPKGTPSRAVHNLSLHSSEREVILGDSLKMVVTGVKKGTGRYDPTEVYLKVIL